MKNSFKTLVAIAAFGALTLAAHAQPAVKLMVVDMAKLYDTHYKTVEHNAKIQSEEAKAGEEIARLQKELNTLADEYKTLTEQAANPVITADAKAKVQVDAQKKIEAIQAKQREGEAFVQQSRQVLGQRWQTYKNLMLEEISKTAADIAKRKGATLLIDKTGPTGFGISNVLYTDAAYDITDEVSKELNKDRPANAPTAPVAAPAAASGAAAPAPAPAAPAPNAGVSLPGVKK